MRHSASLGVLLAMVLPALAHVEMIYPPREYRSTLAESCCAAALT